MDSLQTDCFILCYAINNRASFANIETKWIPELKHHCPKAAIVLVGKGLGTRTKVREKVKVQRAYFRISFPRDQNGFEGSRRYN